MQHYKERWYDIKLPNGLYCKLKDVRHIPCFKKFNLSKLVIIIRVCDHFLKELMICCKLCSSDGSWKYWRNALSDQLSVSEFTIVAKKENYNLVA